MRICFPKETHEDENRVSVLPQTVKKYIDLGVDIAVEEGYGASIAISDDEYEKAGASVLSNEEIYSSADVIFRLRKPELADIEKIKPETLHVSFLDPFNEKELIVRLAAAGIKAVSMEMIPRSTRAQKMDALSSQANLAGYSTVITAAQMINKALPMMMTPAGTISPCRVFVIGVGVAGLQAIATAKRLGARVEAFDTRPVVEEQVQSLGAKFVKIDLGETGQTENGYAKELTPEQLELQKQGMAKVCAQSDIVITTAQLFGRPAPRIVTKAMVEAMKPGSIIVDMAVTTGGNVEGSVAGETVDINGVKIVGIKNLPGEVAESASLVYANNLYNFFDEFWDKEAKQLKIDREDEIIASCLITDGGEIVNERVK